MNTEQVAQRLVELCRRGEYDQAQAELYAEDAVSIEPEGLPPEALGNAHGMDAIREKGRKFAESIEAMHGTSCSDPVGSSPDSTRMRTHASATYAVGVAGFTIVGTPARKAGANFSSEPHTGKLKALICTATPGSRV